MLIKKKKKLSQYFWFLYFRSDKCSLDEHKRLFSKTQTWPKHFELQWNYFLSGWKRSLCNYDCCSYTITHKRLQINAFVLPQVQLERIRQADSLERIRAILNDTNLTDISQLPETWCHFLPTTPSCTYKHMHSHTRSTCSSDFRPDSIQWGRLELAGLGETLLIPTTAICPACTCVRKSTKRLPSLSEGFVSCNATRSCRSFDERIFCSSFSSGNEKTDNQLMRLSTVPWPYQSSRLFPVSALLLFRLSVCWTSSSDLWRKRTLLKCFVHTCIQIMCVYCIS